MTEAPTNRAGPRTVGLDEAVLPAHPDQLLHSWIADAETAGDPEAWVMVLGTVDIGTGPGGGGAAIRPRARSVVVTAVAADDLQFHTSRGTGKVADLRAVPFASGTFRWDRTHRQVTLSGAVTELDDAVNDARFADRPRPLQLLAYLYETTAPGPAPLLARELAARYTRLDAELLDRPTRPPSWTGYRLRPDVMEFWQRGDPSAGTPNERVRYSMTRTGWRRERVLP